MTIHYELEKADFVESSGLAAKDKRTGYLFYVAGAVIAFVEGLVCVYLNYILFGIFLIVLGQIILVKRFSGWNTIRIPIAKAPKTRRVTLIFTNDGLLYGNGDVVAPIEWQVFSHYLENEKRFVLMLRRKKTYFVVPKRAFTNAQEVDEARNYFEIIKIEHPPLAKPH